MSGSNVCRLCRSSCNDSIRLRDANSKANEIYYITIKFFHPTFLNVDKDATNPLAVLCMTCWHHISIFNNFQQTVLLLQSNLAKEAQLLKESNESQKHEGSGDTNLKDGDEDDVIEGKNIELINQASEKSANGFGRGQLIVTDKAVLFETNVGSMTDTIAMGEDAGFTSGKGESEEFSQDEESRTDGEFLVADECEDSHNSDNTMDLQQLPGIASTSANSSTVPPSERKPHRIVKSAQERDAIIAKWRPQLDCYVCSETYTTFTDIQQHFHEHHPKDEFYIMCCDRKWKYRFRTADHALFHMDPNAFKCSSCERVFKSNSYLQDHITYIHPEARLDPMSMCEICGIWLKTKCLAKHRRIHRGRHAHECRHCEHTFKSNNALVQHMKYVHLGKKPRATRTCELCEEICNDRKALYHHQVHYHPELISRAKEKLSA